MKSSPQLFELVQSLSSSEKRYFKIYARRHVIGQKNLYLRLFDAIESQSEYNEDLILRKLASILSKKKISFAKNYLYRLILESLRSFHSGKTVDMQLREGLTELNILYARQLYTHCEKIILKMLPLAEEHEKFFEYIRLQEIYLDVLRRSNQIVRLEKELPGILDRIRDMVGLIGNTYTYYSVSALSNLAILKYNYTQKNDIWENLGREFGEYLGDPGKALGWQSKLHFYRYKIGHGQQFADQEAVLANSLAAIAHFHANPQMISQHLSDYAGILRYAFQMFRIKEDFDNALKYLELLKEIPSKYPGYMTEFLEVFIFSHSTQLELYIAYVQRDAERILVLAEEISAGMIRLKGKIPQNELYPLQSNLAISLYELNLLPEALKLINGIINDSDPNLTPFVQTMMRMIALMIHYDLGNFDIIEALVRSTERHNEAYQCLSPVNEVFLRMMRRLDRAQTEDKKLKALNMAVGELEAIDEIVRNDHFLTPLVYEWIEKHTSLMHKAAAA